MELAKPEKDMISWITSGLHFIAHVMLKTQQIYVYLLYKNNIEIHFNLNLLRLRLTSFLTALFATLFVEVWWEFLLNKGSSISRRTLTDTFAECKCQCHRQFYVHTLWELTSSQLQGHARPCHCPTHRARTDPYSQSHGH